MTVTIMRSRGARSDARRIPAGARWCRLGRDEASTEELARRSPPGTQLDVASRFHDGAEHLRAPFAKLMETWGRAQPDLDDWWASLAASRSPFHSDLFLLACQQRLALELVEGHAGLASHVVILVEDPWLLRSLARHVEGQAGVLVEEPRFALAAFCIGRVVRGALLRALLVAQVVGLALLAAARRGTRRPDADGKGQVAIVSLVQPRTVDEERYHDPYFPGLEELLGKRGIPVVRPLLAPYPPSLTSRLRRHRATTWPLVLDLRPTDLALALRVWRPVLPTDTRVETMPVADLLERERWVERGRAAYSRNLMLRRQFARFLRRSRCRTVFHIFEAQPWEKMIALAARDVGGVRVVGYQHSSVARFQIQHFLGPREADITPLPDRILTNGETWHGLLEKEGGYPAGTLRRAGAWRYPRVTRTFDRDRPRRRAIVALPAEPSLARAMIRGAVAASTELPAGWTLGIRPHPALPIKPVLSISSSTPMTTLLEDAGVVVASGTTTLEAVNAGARVIVPRSPTSLDLDPSVGAGVDGVQSVEAGQLAGAILAASMAPPRRASTHVSFFDPVDPDVWIDEASTGRSPSSKTGGLK